MKIKYPGKNVTFENEGMKTLEKMLHKKLQLFMMFKTLKKMLLISSLAKIT